MAVPPQMDLVVTEVCASAAVALTLGVVACGSATLDPDAGSSHDVGAAGTAWREITLPSGLLVQVYGPQPELDALGPSPTASTLCTEFDLAVAAAYTVSGELLRYSATAYFKNCPPDICDIYGPLRTIPDTHYEWWVSPLTGYSAPPPLRSAGYYNHPFAVTMYLTGDDEANSRWYTSLYSTVTLGPRAGMVHRIAPDDEFFPEQWSAPATADRYSGSDNHWVRQIDDWPSLCVGDTTGVVLDAASRFYISDLSECGILFAMPFPINGKDTAWIDAATNQCPPAPEQVVVLLTGTAEHPGFATPCPRDEGGDIPYQCISISGAEASD